MIGSVSNLPATSPNQPFGHSSTSSNARDYETRDGALRTDVTAPEQAGSGLDPVVVVSLSEYALKLVTRQTSDPMREAFIDGSQQATSMRALMETRRQIAELNRDLKPSEFARAQLADHQAAYERIQNTKPVARQELTGEAKHAAFELLSRKGYARPGVNQTVNFADGDIYYRFSGDGSVWTSAVGVPTSEAEKQGVLATLSRSIIYGQQDMSASLSQRDALQARYEALKAGYEQTYSDS